MQSLPAALPAPPTCPPNGRGKPTCAFVTFGCKINFYETEALRESIVALGYEERTDAEAVDLAVVNCCTVTSTAGAEGVSRVRRLARRNPRALIIVTGCLSAEDRAAMAAIPRVAHIVGNEEKDQIPALIDGAALRRVRDRRSRAIFRLRAERFTGRTRAFLKVHDGCDSFCSYCIIPFLRGKSHSRAHADVIVEARAMVAAGHRELVLTGIHLSQYGKDLPERTTLSELLRTLRGLPGLLRLRLSSIGEGAFTPELLELFATDDAYCPFFHVPLQSGSNSVLERMRRDYTAEEYLRVLDRIRARLPHAMIATDLMIGFPGETAREFDESLATCRRAGFAKMHIFPYSPRSGTRAARFGEHVLPAVKAERVRAARALERELADAERGRRTGSRMRVLIETAGTEHAEGLSREGFAVRVAANPCLPERNEEVEATIAGFAGEVLAAEWQGRHRAATVDGAGPDGAG
ncbi:MAG: tRNA (N(6)-L-threonylcarbamoyladenosine(37)-C(2))-methylthiotransferase MtaB [Planctomycetes bacterium]|nr:tRNA (N(6)-L-threonylcarbamoyladenosine(37)-C(2))-methylthiotransferase MtaB [Planctomycetota bacterium]